MTTIDISYLNINDRTRTLTGLISSGHNGFTDGKKKYHIDKTGQYDRLWLLCNGKCNTYWRTIGSYPIIIDNRIINDE